jgi:hypothetical protein
MITIYIIKPQSHLRPCLLGLPIITQLQIRLKFEILIHEKLLNLVFGVNYSKPRVISSRPRVTSSRYGVWTA